MFRTIPFTARVVKATEARLEAIYRAAWKGLKGDSLALAAGMLPLEYRRLVELDPMAELAAQKGRADAELAHANALAEASLAGDATASLNILKHQHGWVAKQQIDVNVTQISIIGALEEARGRINALSEAQSRDARVIEAEQPQEQRQIEDHRTDRPHQRHERARVVERNPAVSEVRQDLFER